MRCEWDGERTVEEWYDNYWELLGIIENYRELLKKVLQYSLSAPPSRTL
jgi:hypothetical protein